MRPNPFVWAIVIVVVGAGIVLQSMTSTRNGTSSSSKVEEPRRLSTVDNEQHREPETAEHKKLMAERNEACRRSGKCEAGGACQYFEPAFGVELTSFSTDDCGVASDDDCSASKVCSLMGHCHADAASRRCYIRDHADCMRSKLCKEEGWCSRVVGVDPHFSDGFDRHCAPERHDDCELGSNSKAEKRVCAVDGECVKKRGGKCPR